MYEEKRIKIIRRILCKQEKDIYAVLTTYNPEGDPTYKRALWDDIAYIKSDALGRIRAVCAAKKLERLEEFEKSWL